MGDKYRRCSEYDCQRKAVVEEARRNCTGNGNVYCAYHFMRRVNQIMMTWSHDAIQTIYFLPLKDTGR